MQTPSAIRRLVRDSWPPAMVLVFAALVISLIALIRSPEGVGSSLTREQFWLRKIEQPPEYDMVLGGDSRVLCDLSPAVMTGVNHLRTLNFGFNFTGYEPRYLSALAGKLDPASAKRSIVLGITPRSLTPLNMRVSGFLEEISRTESEQLSIRYLGGALSRVRPVVLGTVFGELSGRKSAKVFYPDGFMSVELVPPDPEFELKTYSSIFLGNRVSEQGIQDLLVHVAEWADAGIKVFGLRPPVAPKILAAENASSGFDEAAFATRFESAGGHWLRPDASGLVFADGSHIAAGFVPIFSARLARSIAATGALPDMSDSMTKVGPRQ